MLKRIYFLLIYFFTWVVFFEIARFFFIVSCWKYASKEPIDLVIQSFWYGLRMDISMAAYLCIIICLLVFGSIFFPFFRTARVYHIYTALILFIQLVLVVTDVEIFKAWGNRVDFTVFKYFSSPKEIWASISHLPIFWIIAGLVIFYLIIFWIFKKMINKAITLLQSTKQRWLQSILALLGLILLIIPIRGGIQSAPINHSRVFFSNNQFANNAAINLSWNFLFSIANFNQLNTNPYEYMTEANAMDLTGQLFKSEGKIEQLINASDSVKPNVVLIVWESFTEKVLNLKAEGKYVVPGFRKLIGEGIYFSNCYSSGDRTDKGISAILSGYPALPKRSIVNIPQKTVNLFSLGDQFNKNRYFTSFYYGGEPEFNNIKSYLISQKFEKYVTIKDFNENDLNSKWGAHDGVVMKRIIEDLSNTTQPFFANWLTLSSHEPFETPVRGVFNGKDKQTKYLNSLHYTDSVIFEFIVGLKKLQDWDNTLVIITADHGHYLPITGDRADDFRIPLLWMGGAMKKKNLIINRTVSQMDIAGSLVQQLNFPDRPFRFSKNLFDSSDNKWAFFTFNNGIGFVTDSSRILFDNTGNRLVFEEGKSGKEQTEIAKALMQIVYADFLKR